MIDTPQILVTEDLPCAMIHLVVPVAEIHKGISAALTEIDATLKAQGVQPAGAWFTHHLAIPQKTFDCEICVPVADAIHPSGRVVPGMWPATKVARTIHRGSYEGLTGAWGEFMLWTTEQGLTFAPGGIWERYLVNQRDTADADALITELNFGIAETHS